MLTVYTAMVALIRIRAAGQKPDDDDLRWIERTNGMAKPLIVGPGLGIQSVDEVVRQSGMA